MSKRRASRRRVAIAMLAGLMTAPLPSVRATGMGMDFGRLAGLAEALARSAYQPRPELALPPMQYAQFHDVVFRPDLAVWKDRGLPFQLQFFPVGWLHKKGVTLYEVVDGDVHPMPTSTDMFTHAKDSEGREIQLPDAVSGFRAHAPLRPGGSYDEFLVFMGASYFRALARGMGYGISARGVAVDTVQPKGEEFPDFTSFWIVRPAPGDTRLTIYALLDGPSISGAYRLTATTGERTQVDVKSALFLRQDVAQLGIAPLTSMFWYGENSDPRPPDYRPEVHDSDGLLIGDRQGGWTWRPLLLSPAIRHSTFAGGALAGFGLMLRDRDFDHYQDLGAHAETRPGLWVEPGGNWGQGRVHLVEIPTSNEYMDNIVAFWQPAEPASAGRRFDLDYRLSWRPDDPERIPLGRVIATRHSSLSRLPDGNTTSSYRAADLAELQEFVVDFSAIDGLPCDERHTPEVVVEASPGAEVVKSFVVANPETGGWRAFSQFRFADPNRTAELALRLVSQGKIVSETWNYLWQP